jgi:hypothetical protein
MTDLRQAAEMALECLEYHWDNPDSDLEDTPYVLEAKQALRQALAHHVDNVYMSEERVHKTEESIHEPVCFLRETSWSYEIAPWDDPNGIPVYTAPPSIEAALRQALAHEALDRMVAENQRLGLYDDAVSMSQERVDKTAKGEHEPVAWMKPSGLVSPYKHGSYQIPLYAAPPKREWVGLTADEIWKCNKAEPGSAVDFHICVAHQNVLDFAEAIEAKLKEKNA